ncbi:MAG TPA: hypothetical protein VMF06_04380 [Candidatus Limnocylindria bacterium]|jgi:hypothetical protein|nr:hypothetical protein [Candidatus Limnocylindria bacterium]
MKSIFALLLGILLSGTAAYAVSDVPSVVNYQGKLLNSSGNQVTDGTYTINFKLYGASSGSIFLWGSTYSVVVSGGYFNVILGEGGAAISGATYTSVGTALGATTTPYLGLTITADGNGPITNPSEIAPRLRFLSSPYALVAENAKFADSATSANNAQTLQNLSASSFLQPGNSAATTLNGNLTAPNVTVNSTLAVNGSGTVSGNLTVNGTLSAPTTTGGGFVPVGGIIMWSGSPTAVPSGWALCNGSGTYNITVNGGTTAYSVPDLRDRFVVGAGGSYSSRQTGGNASVTLALGNIPAHRHIFRDTIWGENNLGGGGRSPDGLGSGYDGGNNYVGSHNGWDGDNNLSWVERYSYYAGAHDGVGNGGTDSIDIRPPYYALAFIIRTQ